MAVITTPVKVWGVEPITVADIGTYITANLQALIDGRVLKIADQVLAASAASVTFSSIPQTYRHLEISWTARSDAAGNNVDVLGQFNGDTGANYDYEHLYLNGASPAALTGAEGIGATATRLGEFTAAGPSAGQAGVGRIAIPNYAGSAFWKNADYSSSFRIGTATGQFFKNVGAGFWRSTAAITSIKLFPSVGNFIAGSVFSLYGAM